MVHQQVWPQICWLIICDINLLSFFSVGTGAEELIYQSDKEVFMYRAHTFADGTKSTYRTYRDSYFQFCQFTGYPPVPATTSVICQYAAFLARSLKATSIWQYLGVIGLLHKEFGLPNPLLENWALSSLMKGIK